MFTNLQALLWSIYSLREQILHFLVVDLDHGNGYLALDALSGVIMKDFDSFEDLFAGARHDTFIFSVTDNGITFS